MIRAIWLSLILTPMVQLLLIGHERVRWEPITIPRSRSVARRPAPEPERLNTEWTGPTRTSHNRTLSIITNWSTTWFGTSSGVCAVSLSDCCWLTPASVVLLPLFAVSVRNKKHSFTIHRRQRKRWNFKKWVLVFDRSAYVRCLIVLHQNCKYAGLCETETVLMCYCTISSNWNEVKR